MSLLEDVFLEDEAGEAQELERVIEGDELDERPRTPDSNEASEKEDEAEEDKRVVDHTAKAKRVVKNPRFVLNPARLMGPRGIQIIPEHFKDFKFKGKGHEREDLDIVLKKLEHWAYRLYPKFKFDDCLKKIETLGRKRPVMVHLHKIRTDQYLSEETVQQQDSSGDEVAPAPQQEEDEFDRLLQQQIELARSTPAPNSARKELHTPMSSHRSPLMLPKVSSSPSISDEQKERMMKNRRLAEERRLAKLNLANNSTHNSHNANTSTETIAETVEPSTVRSAVHDTQSTEDINITKVADNDRIIDDVDKYEPVIRKHNRANVIDSDSSDDENDVMVVSESVSVDVHNSVIKEVNRSTEAISKRTIELNTDGAPENDIIMERVVNDASDDVIDDVPVVKKQNRSNVIDSDSSDDENVLTINESATVDVQNTPPKDIDTEEHNSDKESTAVEETDVESNKSVTTDVPFDNSSGNNKKSENDFSEMDEPSNETSKDTRSKTTNISNVNKTDKISSETANQIEDEKKDNSVPEELMDVDFSDDF